MKQDHAMAIVCMPFSDASIPSIQLGVLAGLVRAAGWQAETFHFNLDLAARLPNVYDDLCDLDDEFIGDWLFAGAAFDGSQCMSSDTYLDRFTLDPETGHKDTALQEYLLRLQKVVIPEFIEYCLGQLESLPFDVVGFTSVFQQNVASLALARRLKERRPDLVIVFGGANVHGDMGVAYLEAFPFIDYVALGEAELCLKPLLDAIALGTRATDVPGIATRTDKGGVASPQPELIKDLSIVPIPDYDEYFARRRRLGLPHAANTLPIETSRGCWWGERSHCIFCGLNGNDMRFRTKPEAMVIEELEQLSRRYGAHAFNVTDNIMPRQYVETLFPKLKETPYRFFYEVKANLTPSELRVMRDGGVRRILPGIESLSTDILRLLRKGASKLHNIRLLIAARLLGINVSWYLLHGVPGETAEMYQDEAASMRLLGHLEPPARCARIRMDRFSPLFQQRNGPAISWSRPWEAYRSIYPPEVDLERAAYFFEYHSPQTLPESFHQPTFQLVESWQHEWARRAPILQWYRREDSVIVQDSRFGEEREFTLGAAAGRVLDECSDIRSLDFVSDLADQACIAELLELG
ncbi:MAG TPA: RiPP maturation radical SAM C-methyltransferase, partial [Tepidisphaeraceae bacterium]|nr:RiPP maturation radical SAM C-methyltransferase [Tepidisphaeraceae bacterium]